MLDALPIEFDREGGRHAFTSTLDLAREYGISTYDAAYLEPAMRSGLALATLDGHLRRAADEAGLPSS
jgi:predicted nucleic acid-binding protein